MRGPPASLGVVRLCLAYTGHYVPISNVRCTRASGGVLLLLYPLYSHSYATHQIGDTRAQQYHTVHTTLQNTTSTQNTKQTFHSTAHILRSTRTAAAHSERRAGTGTVHSIRMHRINSHTPRPRTGART